MRRILLAFATTALLPGVAHAQVPHGILEADTDRDGAVSRAEFLAMNAARFARMDKNRDGLLSFEERIPERAPNGLRPLDSTAQWRPGDVDANGDRFVTRDEFFLNLGLIYARFDPNGDDQVAGSEIAPAGSPRP